MPNNLINSLYNVGDLGKLDLGCLSEVIFNTTQNGFLIMQSLKM